MATKKEQEVVIRPLEVREAQVRIVGETPLVVHAWAAKAKREMLEAQQGKKKGKAKAIRRPADDFVEAAFWLTPKPKYSEAADDAEIMEAFDAAVAAGARFGFPATAIKQATQSAAYRLGWVKNQMSIRGSLFIESDENGLVEIISEPPVMLESMVKIGMGTADLRYRPVFLNWSMNLTIRFTEQLGISFENLMNAINAGGFVCGIGEWRPERDGDYGRYRIG